MKIGLLGAGAMGEAIVAAVTSADQPVAKPQDIRIFDVAGSRLQTLHAQYGVQVAESPQDAVDGAEYVMLAVKPQDFEVAVAPIADKMTGVAVSIMAGVTVERLRRGLRSDRLVRAMPNTPAQIGEGMTVWTSTPEVDEVARAGVAKIFAALGREAYVPDEKYLDMATGLSGSGPAYVFLFIEALTDAGVHIGLSRELASTMALQTVLGSARYAEATGKHPAELRNQVTSPGGTTAEALRVLEMGSFRADVLEAVTAAFNKSKALGEESKK